MRNAQSSLQSFKKPLSENKGGEFDVISRQFIARLMNSRHESAVAFKNALDDDFNTPLAFAEMFKYANLLKKKKPVCALKIYKKMFKGNGRSSRLIE